MKLSSIYSNRPKEFSLIKFNPELNIVLGEVRDPQNIEKDTHNLGKTTLARLLDFMFLSERDSKLFLFKHFSKFESFIFFLEIEISTNHYLTIKRGVQNNTLISFELHDEKFRDFSQYNSWAHSEVTIKNAKLLLDGWLNFKKFLPDDDYRKIIGFTIRKQDDFQQIFKLTRDKGADGLWKPHVAALLGLDGELAIQNYQIKSEIQALNKIIHLQGFEISSLSEHLSKIDNDLLLKKEALKQHENLIHDLNFNSIDQENIEELVEELESEISQKNTLEYSLKSNIKRVEESLSIDQIQFNSKKVKDLFDETSILLPDQIIKDFDQLVDFNKKITRERNKYLKEELVELRAELIEVRNTLKELNKKRSEQLCFLTETDILKKIKNSSNYISDIKGDIEYIKQQKISIEKILLLEESKHNLEEKLSTLHKKIQINLTKVTADSTSTLSKVRIYFNEIIKVVLSHSGQVLVYLNKEGNFEFNATFRNSKGENTSEDEGHSYKKFLCIAFDLAIAMAYKDSSYPKFLYIDGVFEGLDDRKKRKMLEILNRFCVAGFQIIITSICSDIASIRTQDDNLIKNTDIILTLHDDGISGKLFKMPSW